MGMSKYEFNKNVIILKTMTKSGSLKPSEALSELQDIQMELPADTVYFNRIQDEFIKEDAPYQKENGKFYVQNLNGEELVSKLDVIAILNQIQF